MESDRSTKKPLLRRPGFWVVVAITAAIIISNVNAFPGGRYECAWSGSRPKGELAGDLVVTVGNWPDTYPLKARIYTPTGPVTVENWTHAHSTWAREFYATIPTGTGRYRALCELE